MHIEDDSFARELDQLHRNADRIFNNNILDKSRLKRINFIRNQLHKIEDGEVVVSDPYKNLGIEKTRLRYSSDSELSLRHNQAQLTH